MKALAKKGCKDDDILTLLATFDARFEKVLEVFNGLGKRSREDPDGERQLRLKDLTLFISKIEDEIDSELETLRNHIIKGTVQKVNVISFAQFYEFVPEWAERIW
mmetsp:Transcript_37585/g.57582  ORF Transcript_37585/g.57582 Transcript_37585/m.57582 type:complete len:105 (+) Transcript_37585:51-365(+)